MAPFLACGHLAHGALAMAEVPRAVLWILEASVLHTCFLCTCLCAFTSVPTLQSSRNNLAEEPEATGQSLFRSSRAIPRLPLQMHSVTLRTGSGLSCQSRVPGARLSVALGAWPEKHGPKSVD